MVSSLSDGGTFVCSDLMFGLNRAIDLAVKFPDAQVSAVDISPMVHRFVPDSLSKEFPYQFSLSSLRQYSPVPPNLQFQQLDIMADPLPWEPSSFDVVHARLLLIHVRL